MDPSSGPPAAPLRPATDAEVGIALRLHGAAGSPRNRQLAAAVAGRAAPVPAEQVAEGLAAFLEELLLPLRQTSFRATLASERLRELGVVQVEAVDSLLHRFFDVLVERARDPQVLRGLQAGFEELRPELRLAAAALREASEQIVERLDAGLFMQRYGRSVSRAQAAVLQPVVAREREALRTMFATLIAVVEAERPIDVLALLGALVHDQRDAAREHEQCRQQLEAAGAAP